MGFNLTPKKYYFQLSPGDENAMGTYHFKMTLVNVTFPNFSLKFNLITSVPVHTCLKPNTDYYLM